MVCSFELPLVFVEVSFASPVMLFFWLFISLTTNRSKISGGYYIRLKISQDDKSETQ
jgi:hypothetical protein